MTTTTKETATLPTTDRGLAPQTIARADEVAEKNRARLVGRIEFFREKGYDAEADRLQAKLDAGLSR